MFKYLNKQIETDRLILRLLTIEDAPSIAEIANDERVTSTTSLPYPYKLEHALGWIENAEANFDNDVSYEFGIFDKVTNEIYGSVGCNYNKVHNHGEIGYWIAPNHWGKKYATEAAMGLLTFAFDVKNIHRIHSCHFDGNLGSGKVMQKIGMSYEGKQIDYVFKNGTYITLIIYGIINPKD